MPYSLCACSGQSYEKHVPPHTHTHAYLQFAVGAVQVLEQGRAVGFRRQKADHRAVGGAAALNHRGPEEAAGVFAEQASERGVPEENRKQVEKK